MFFLKKFLLGFGALFLIFLGGAGTQSHSSLAQGGGFLGLILGLVVLYIFSKMAWRALGCLPSLFLIAAIMVFILYAIGAFSGGINNFSQNIMSFLGRSTVSSSNNSENKVDINSAKVAPISENFSSPSKNVQPQKKENMLNKFFAKNEHQEKASGFNPNNYPTIYTQAQVISGDTFLIGGGRYLRLFGIDAPENNQTCADGSGRAYSCGQQAISWLRSWIQDNELECHIIQQDERGNMVGVCSLGAYDIGAALVNAGWAVVYTPHSNIYIPYQENAQREGNGLWQGEFYMPWDWRKIQARKPKIKIINKKRSRKRTLLNPLG